MFDYHLDRQLRRFGGRKKSTVKLLSIISVAIFSGLLLTVVGVAFLFAWYAKDLPRPDKVQRSDGLSTIVLDRKGETLYEIFEDENRLPVKFDEIPETLRQATVAVEDKNFYQHQGLSTAGIIRAVVNIFIFHNFQGGSTLTQQLVKNVLLSSERTLPRKIKEAILAIQIERRYTKDEILLMYLNEAPYGGTAVGVEAAAQYYFGKHARELSLTESVFLAGLPQSPSQYSPFTGDSQAYLWRSNQVSRRMREDGYISPLIEAQVNDELKRLTFLQNDGGLRAPHFVAYVRELLEEKFGRQRVLNGGLHITTTLDWALQEKAQQIVKEEVDKAKNLKVSNGAAVIIDPANGEILAMVGSKDYTATDSGGYKFNVATQGLRQPGSAIKPITYATALKKGYTASTLLLDVETGYPSGEVGKPDYKPKNYDLKYRGPVQLRYALGNSINIPAVKLTGLVGIQEVLRTAYDLGLTTLEPTTENTRRFGLSITLGGGEVRLLDLTSAFGVLARSGERVDPVALLKVTDSKGNILFEHKPVPPRQVLAKDIAYIIAHILSDNGARKEIFGERSLLNIPGYTVAVKTGTTDDKRDNWTVGFTPSVVIGVWVGNNDNSPMHSSLASGITGASPIWNRLIREYLKGKKDEPFSRPDSIIEMEIDAYGGGTPQDGQPRRKEIFIKGTEPTVPAPIYVSRKVSQRDSSKLANSVELAKGEFDTRYFVVFKETDPVSGDGKNRWQEGIDLWVSKITDPKYHPPTDTYSEGEQLTVVIKEPSGDTAEVNNNNVKVVAEASGLNDISRLEIFIDGNKVKEVGGKSLSETITVENGSHILMVKATDNKGNAADRQVKLGVGEPYSTPTPAP